MILIADTICVHTYCTCVYSIFLGPAINGSLPDYDIIEETDPYYWSINESDMLSDFNHEIADHAAIADTIPSSVNGCSPPYKQV